MYILIPQFVEKTKHSNRIPQYKQKLFDIHFVISRITNHHAMISVYIKTDIRKYMYLCMIC